MLWRLENCVGIGIGMGLGLGAGIDSASSVVIGIGIGLIGVLGIAFLTDVGNGICSICVSTGTCLLSCAFMRVSLGMDAVNLLIGSINNR